MATHNEQISAVCTFDMLLLLWYMLHEFYVIWDHYLNVEEHIIV